MLLTNSSGHLFLGLKDNGVMAMGKDKIRKQTLDGDMMAYVGEGLLGTA